MKHSILMLLSGCLLAIPVFASETHDDDPLLSKVTIDRLEVRDEEDTNPLAWEASAWVGRDLEKFWFKTEGIYEDSEVHSAEYQLLYGWAIAPYWDMQVGWRLDSKPEPERNWLAIGVQGVAPYFIETEATLFVGEENMSALRLEFEYELMLTQRWVLVPELEANIYGNNDRERGIGSGLSELEFSVRLLYEIKREFAPYIGINWEKVLGNTADYAEAAGEETSETEFTIGIHAWF
jgi:copper resistance protein B